MRIPPAKDVTSDERIFAALAHALVMLFGWGLVGSVLIWATQREKSRFVTFHALQALTYQIMQMLVWLVAMPVMITVLTLAVLVITLIVSETSLQDPDRVAVLLQFFMFAIMFGVAGAYALAGLIGALSTFTGKDFRYPWLGRWLERYLADEPTSQDEEQPA